MLSSVLHMARTAVGGSSDLSVTLVIPGALVDERTRYLCVGKITESAKS